ncbi:MAG TPA: short-chain dehydrogenase [Vicinamibacteria bacterium]|nr:short-chain dehydrogenase [Vicinamibacteria bacterium]
MDIRGKSVLILGGYGLVGQAVARRLIKEQPRRIVLLSLRREEAEDAVAALGPERGQVELTAAWGDVFAFADVKDRPRREVFEDPAQRSRHIESLIDTLSEQAAGAYYLYQLVTRERPDVIVDSVNTATGIAYQDIYKTSRLAYQALKDGTDLRESLETLLLTDYVPQMIRHVQVLYQAMVKAQTHAYIKIGTSGTGGMGLNIPYTHSEERPSRVLLSKSAMAGAHTLLLFLMARTPGGPITKEIKPAAAIAWKRIGFGPIHRGGRPVALHDVDLAAACALVPGQRFHSVDPSQGRPTGQTLESVFIDTGENGIFSLEEFSAITTGEQMEFVTPEEIAEVVVQELIGGNTGHDVINALDNAVMGPTYRAGLMRHWALEKLVALEKAHGVRSVAFENLGPPRLSKLLHEADLLRRSYQTMDAVRAATPAELSRRLAEDIAEDAAHRREIVSIGIPILLPDGRLLRGPECKIPPVAWAAESHEITPAQIEAWTRAGWVDLREPNLALWKDRFDRIAAEIAELPATDSSSRFLRDRQFWGVLGVIQPGKLVGWIFATEEKGARMK